MRAVLTLFVVLEFFAMGCSPEAAKLYEGRQYEAKVSDPPAATSSAAGGQKLSLPYRLLKPARIEGEKLYPLVLFLHGAGERGDDNELQLKYLPTWLASDTNRRQYPCFVVAPQCPKDKQWSDFSWIDLRAEPLGEMAEPMRAVVGILEELIAQNPIDPAQIYLTGLSMGGYGSWDLALRTPERFAALVPVCGGADESQASRLVGLPIWAWHGDEDKAVPVERSRKMIEAIKAAGGDPKYTELKGVGHDSWTTTYSGPDNVLAWMFQQAKPAGTGQ